MCIHVCIWIYVYIYIYIYIHILYVYFYMYIYICICIFIWIYEEGSIRITFRHLNDLEVVPYPFWHLRDLEVVPHPRGEMLSSMNLTNTQRNQKWEKTIKSVIRLVIYHGFSFFTKSRIWSCGRYAHSGIRVRPKTKKNCKFGQWLYLSKIEAWN